MEYTDKSPEDLILLKWVVTCFFSLLAVYFIYRIIINKPFFASLGKENKNNSSSIQKKKKPNLLSKTEIKTKSERILDKYSKK